MSRALRAMTYDDYNISKDRLHELNAFCKQYQQERQKISYAIRAHSIERPVQTSGYSDATAQAAIRNASARNHVQMIEKAAETATRGLPQEVTKALLLNVTDRTAAIYLPPMPISDSDFYSLRRYFYSLIDTMLRDAVAQYRL